MNRNVGEENTVGAVATTSQFKERHNQTGGVDGRFRLDPKTTISFSLVGTNSHSAFFNPARGDDELRDGKGLGYTLDYNYSGRNFGYEYYSEGNTNDYRADVGFTSRTNTNFHSLFTAYDTTPKAKAKLINWHVHNFTFISHDFQGRSQAWESETNFQFFFQKQFNIGAAYEYAYERLIEEEFGQKRLPAHNGAAAQAGAFAGDDSERSSRKNHYFFFGVRARSIRSRGARSTATAISISTSAQADVSRASAPARCSARMHRSTPAPAASSSCAPRSPINRPTPCARRSTTPRAACAVTTPDSSLST